MTDPLYELLFPDLPSDKTSSDPSPHPRDTVTPKYLSRLTTISLEALTTDEPTFLSQSTHSNLLSLQSLSARSNAALVASSSHLSSLHNTLPRLAAEASSLRHDIPKLDTAAVHFSDRYSRAKDANALLDRRKKALLIARNVDRISDILDLPTLLASAIASSTTSTSATGSTTSSSSASTAIPSTYASALDLHSHIKRLHLLHPISPLISSIYTETESAMRDLTTNLLLSLRAPNIKLAAAMRTIGWLRRVAPELDGASPPSTVSTGRGTTSEGSLGAVFLVSRLSHLMTTLEALSPLRDLADQETEARQRRSNQPFTPHKPTPPSSSSSAATKPTSKPAPRDRDAWSHGQQTERYLKRWLEIFREQSFAIVAMYRSIFPDDQPLPSISASASASTATATSTSTTYTPPPPPDSHQHQHQHPPPLPSALSTFPLHLTTALLLPTLQAYLPNVQDKSSRESLLTQVLYAAGSLGRLGGDFGMVVAELGDVEVEEDGDDDDGGGEEMEMKGEMKEETKEETEMEEWVAVMKKHRVLAGKLERMAAGGVGGG